MQRDSNGQRLTSRKKNKLGLTLRGEIYYEAVITKML